MYRTFAYLSVLDCNCLHIHIGSYCTLRNDKKFREVMNFTEIMAKLNRIIGNNQKLKIGLDISNIHLDNLETQVDGHNQIEIIRGMRIDMRKTTILEYITLFRMSITVMISNVRSK